MRKTQKMGKEIRGGGRSVWWGAWHGATSLPPTSTLVTLITLITPTPPPVIVLRCYIVTFSVYEKVCYASPLLRGLVQAVAISKRRKRL